MVKPVHQCLYIEIENSFYTLLNTLEKKIKNVVF